MKTLSVSPAENIDQIESYVRRTGFALVRGQVRSVDGFKALTDPLFTECDDYGGGFFQNRRRVLGASSVLTATGRRQDFAIPFHSEMHYRAAPPDIIVFYAERPADTGGQTTLLDGRATWSALSIATRHTLATRKIRYTSTLSRPALRTTFGVASLPELERFCARHGYTWRTEGAHFLIDYVTQAIRGQPPAFVNNLVSLWLGEAAHRAGRLNAGIPGARADVFPIVVRFGDGEPIPRDMIEEVQQISRELGCMHVWTQHDVLIVDNMRMLHGRQASNDRARRILVRMGAPVWG